MRGALELRRRKALAFYHYVRRPLRSILPQATALGLLILIGALAFEHLYDATRLEGGRPLGFWRALHVTWSLVFTEHVLPFPEHWFLRLFYFLLPIVGVVVVVDGIVRVSTYLMRRDANSLEWKLAMTKTFEDHVILMGLGKVGLRTLEELLRLDELVVVLEKDESSPNVEIARSKGVPVIFGSGRTPGVMQQLNVARAKSVVCATDDDLANLEVALDARRLRPDIRIVLRMFDKELAEKIRESMGLEAAFSTSQVAAPLFATAASDRSIISSFYVGSRLIVVARSTVVSGAPLATMTVGELEAELGVHVLEHERDGHETFDPRPELALAAGDLLTVQGRPGVLPRFHALNRTAEPRASAAPLTGATP